MDHHGHRVPRSLEYWGEWMLCFDGVQMNEDEFELLGHHTGDPWQLAAGVLGHDLKLITVTLGPRGAAYVAAPGFRDDPEAWRAQRPLSAAGPVRSGRVELDGPALAGDPTGCGDVWGATFFAGLSGSSLDVAMEEANAKAARNVEHRGARGLYRHLVGRLSRVEES